MAEIPELLQWIRIQSIPKTNMPALFLDRDGTVIENSPYLSNPARVSLIPGVRETIASFRAAGFAIIIVTNQSAIARGLCSIEQYQAVESRVHQLLEPSRVDVTYACPFHPDGRDPFACDHAWRKPNPGMLLDAARRFQLDLERSWMVGDSLSDIQAGAHAGTGRLVHVATGHGTNERASVEAFVAGLHRQSVTMGPTIHLLPSISELASIAQATLNRPNEFSDRPPLNFVRRNANEQGRRR